MTRATSTTPSSGVAWEPPPTTGKPDWASVAELLRAHPLEWLKVYEHGRTSWAVAVQIGHVSAVRPALGFEVRTTHNTRDTPRTCTLFMRFDPNKVDPLAEIVDNVKQKG